MHPGPVWRLLLAQWLVWTCVATQTNTHIQIDGQKHKQIGNDETVIGQDEETKYARGQTGETKFNMGLRQIGKMEETGTGRIGEETEETEINRIIKTDIETVRRIGQAEEETMKEQIGETGVGRIGETEIESGRGRIGGKVGFRPSELLGPPVPYLQPLPTFNTKRKINQRPASHSSGSSLSLSFVPPESTANPTYPPPFFNTLPTRPSPYFNSLPPHSSPTRPSPFLKTPSSHSSPTHSSLFLNPWPSRSSTVPKLPPFSKPRPPSSLHQSPFPKPRPPLSPLQTVEWAGVGDVPSALLNPPPVKLPKWTPDYTPVREAYWDTILEAIGASKDKLTSTPSHSSEIPALTSVTIINNDWIPTNITSLKMLMNASHTNLTEATKISNVNEEQPDKLESTDPGTEADERIQDYGEIFVADGDFNPLEVYLPEHIRSELYKQTQNIPEAYPAAYSEAYSNPYRRDEVEFTSTDKIQAPTFIPWPNAEGGITKLSINTDIGDIKSKSVGEKLDYYYKEEVKPDAQYQPQSFFSGLLKDVRSLAFDKEDTPNLRTMLQNFQTFDSKSDPNYISWPVTSNGEINKKVDGELSTQPTPEPQYISWPASEIPDGINEKVDGSSLSHPTPKPNFIQWPKTSEQYSIEKVDGSALSHLTHHTHIPHSHIVASALQNSQSDQLPIIVMKNPVNTPMAEEREYNTDTNNTSNQILKTNDNMAEKYANEVYNEPWFHAVVQNDLKNWGYPYDEEALKNLPPEYDNQKPSRRNPVQSNDKFQADSSSVFDDQSIPSPKIRNAHHLAVVEAPSIPKDNPVLIKNVHVIAPKPDDMPPIPLFRPAEKKTLESPPYLLSGALARGSNLYEGDTAPVLVVPHPGSSSPSEPQDRTSNLYSVVVPLKPATRKEDSFFPAFPDFFRTKTLPKSSRQVQRELMDHLVPPPVTQRPKLREILHVQNPGFGPPKGEDVVAMPKDQTEGTNFTKDTNSLQDAEIPQKEPSLPTPRPRPPQFPPANAQQQRPIQQGPQSSRPHHNFPPVPPPPKFPDRPRPQTRPFQNRPHQNRPQQQNQNRPQQQNQNRPQQQNQNKPNKPQQHNQNRPNQLSKRPQQQTQIRPQQQTQTRPTQRPQFQSPPPQTPKQQTPAQQNNRPQQQNTQLNRPPRHPELPNRPQTPTQHPNQLPLEPQINTLQPFGFRQTNFNRPSQQFHTRPPQLQNQAPQTQDKPQTQNRPSQTHSRPQQPQNTPSQQKQPQNTSQQQNNFPESQNGPPQPQKSQQNSQQQQPPQHKPSQQEQTQHKPQNTHQPQTKPPQFTSRPTRFEQRPQNKLPQPQHTQNRPPQQQLHSQNRPPRQPHFQNRPPQQQSHSQNTSPQPQHSQTTPPQPQHSQTTPPQPQHSQTTPPQPQHSQNRPLQQQPHSQNRPHPPQHSQDRPPPQQPHSQNRPPQQQPHSQNRPQVPPHSLNIPQQPNRPQQTSHFQNRPPQQQPHSQNRPPPPPHSQNRPPTPPHSQNRPPPPTHSQNRPPPPNSQNIPPPPPHSQNIPQSPPHSQNIPQQPNRPTQQTSHFRNRPPQQPPNSQNRLPPPPHSQNLAQQPPNLQNTQGQLANFQNRPLPLPPPPHFKNDLTPQLFGDFGDSFQTPQVLPPVVNTHKKRNTDYTASTTTTTQAPMYTTTPEPTYIPWPNSRPGLSNLKGLGTNFPFRRPTVPNMNFLNPLNIFRNREETAQETTTPYSFLPSIFRSDNEQSSSEIEEKFEPPPPNHLLSLHLSPPHLSLPYLSPPYLSPPHLNTNNQKLANTFNQQPSIIKQATNIFSRPANILKQASNMLNQPGNIMKQISDTVSDTVSDIFTSDDPPKSDPSLFFLKDIKIPSQNTALVNLKPHLDPVISSNENEHQQNTPINIEKSFDSHDSGNNGPFSHNSAQSIFTTLQPPNYGEVNTQLPIIPLQLVSLSTNPPFFLSSSNPPLQSSNSPIISSTNTPLLTSSNPQVILSPDQTRSINIQVSSSFNSQNSSPSQPSGPSIPPLTSDQISSNNPEAKKIDPLTNPARPDNPEKPEKKEYDGPELIKFTLEDVVYPSDQNYLRPYNPNSDLKTAESNNNNQKISYDNNNRDDKYKNYNNKPSITFEDEDQHLSPSDDMHLSPSEDIVSVAKVVSPTVSPRPPTLMMERITFKPLGLTTPLPSMPLKANSTLNIPHITTLIPHLKSMSTPLISTSAPNIPLKSTTAFSPSTWITLDPITTMKPKLYSTTNLPKHPQTTYKPPTTKNTTKTKTSPYFTLNWRSIKPVDLNIDNIPKNEKTKEDKRKSTTTPYPKNIPRITIIEATPMPKAGEVYPTVKHFRTFVSDFPQSFTNANNVKHGTTPSSLMEVPIKTYTTNYSPSSPPPTILPLKSYMKPATSIPDTKPTNIKEVTTNPPYTKPVTPKPITPTPYSKPATTKPVTPIPYRNPIKEFNMNPTPNTKPSNPRPNATPTPYSKPGNSRPNITPTPFSKPGNLRPNITPTPFSKPGNMRPNVTPTPFSKPKPRPNVTPAPFSKPGNRRPNLTNFYRHTQTYSNPISPYVTPASTSSPQTSFPKSKWVTSNPEESHREPPPRVRQNNRNLPPGLMKQRTRQDVLMPGRWNHRTIIRPPKIDSKIEGRDGENGEERRENTRLKLRYTNPPRRAQPVQKSLQPTQTPVIMTNIPVTPTEVDEPHNQSSIPSPSIVESREIPQSINQNRLPQASQTVVIMQRPDEKAKDINRPDETAKDVNDNNDQETKSEATAEVEQTIGNTNQNTTTKNTTITSELSFRLIKPPRLTSLQRIRNLSANRRKNNVVTRLPQVLSSTAVPVPQQTQNPTENPTVTPTPRLEPQKPSGLNIKSFNSYRDRLASRRRARPSQTSRTTTTFAPTTTTRPQFTTTKRSSIDTSQFKERPKERASSSKDSFPPIQETFLQDHTGMLGIYNWESTRLDARAQSDENNENDESESPMKPDPEDLTPSSSISRGQTLFPDASSIVSVTVKPSEMKPSEMIRFQTPEPSNTSPAWRRESIKISRQYATVDRNNRKVDAETQTNDKTERQGEYTRPTERQANHNRPTNGHSRPIERRGGHNKSTEGQEGSTTKVQGGHSGPTWTSLFASLSPALPPHTHLIHALHINDS